MKCAEETLLQSTYDKKEAAQWQLYYAELLVKQGRQNRFSIAMHPIQGVKPRTYGVYLVPC